MTQPAATIQDTTLGTLFRYKAWADAELMTLLCQPVEALDEADQAHAYTATNTPETPTPEQLSWDMADTAAWLLDFANHTTPEGLNERVSFTFTDGDHGCMTRLEMLLHMHAHGTYHRVQVSQMLKQIGLVQPRELLTRMLHAQEPERRQPAS